MSDRSESSGRGRVRVVVVTRTRDRPILLRRAIESVLGQTLAGWRHVIVNDGGDAAALEALTAEYVSAYRGRLQVIHNPDSIGMQNASNQAIRQSDSDYLTIHDDDDSWAPGFLSACVERLDAEGPDSGVQGVVTRTTWVFEELEPAGRVVERWRQDYPMPETLHLMDLAGENRFPPIAFLYRRYVHERIGYFNHDFTVMGDWDFNLRFLSCFEIGVIPDSLACYHWRHQSHDNAYGNTVTAGLAQHKCMEARLFNSYLRHDLESGRIGLGAMMNVSRPIVHLSRQVAEWRDHLEQRLLSSPLEQKLQASLDDHSQLAVQVQELTGQLAGLAVRVDQSVNAATAALAQAEHMNRITRDLARIWEAKDWVRRSILILRERRELKRRGTPAPPTVDPRAEIARFTGSLGAGDVLSLDVFDTALLRMVARPPDVFALMEPAARTLLAMPDLLFAETRLAAEREARRLLADAGGAEVTLDQIYREWGATVGVSRDMADRVRDLEIATERRVCYANPVILDVFKSVGGRGIRTVFVSDMYLPTAVIKTLLEENGYTSPEVYVSGDLGKTKHGGALFEHVLNRLECPASRWFHVGDNEASDLHRPRELGITSLHLDRHLWGGSTLIDEHTGLTGRYPPDPLSSLMTGLVHRRELASGRDAIWGRLGYEVTGPLMYGFVRWIARQALDHGVRHLFFLSRDGYYIEKAFQACARQWGLAIESTYMYASRRLLNLARITRIDEAALDFLLSSNPLLTVGDMLARIGLSADSLATEISNAGLTGPGEVLTTLGGIYQSPETRERAKRLLRGLGPRILEIAAEERRKVRSYFSDIGFKPGDIAIVDVGWQASSIRSLQDLLRMDQPDYPLRGYYFGTWCFAQPSVEAGCLIDSFYIHLHEPAHRAALIAECVEMVEHLFSAPHPTVVSLVREQETWAPVCGSWETDDAQRRDLERMSHQALAFVRDMLAVDPELSPYPAPDGYMDGVLERILKFPSFMEAKSLGALPHRDSFGGDAPWRHLANIPSAWQPVFRPGEFRHAYARSYWRRGFLIQVSPTERQMLGAG